MFELENVLLFIALGANVALGGIVWTSNSKDKLNNAFGFFSIVTVSWILLNIYFINISHSVEVLKIIHAVGAVVLPSAIAWTVLLTGRVFSRRYYFILAFSIIAITSLTIFTNLIIQNVVPAQGFKGYVLISGQLFTVYALYQFILYVLLITALIRGIHDANVVERKRRILILIGVFLFGFVTIATSFIAPILYKESAILSYDAQSSFFFVIFSAVAILRYRLFEIKVVTTELFTFSLWVVLFVRILISESLKEAIVGFLLLVAVIILGIFQIRSVKREIENREKGERLARYLANANARLRELDKQKTDFVSIASHQLRSPIAAIKGYTSLITDGSYGDVPEKLQEPLHRVLESGQRIGIMVDDFLNITRIEQGRMIYNMVPQNICAIVETVIGELRVVAEEKGLSLSMTCDNKENFLVKVDEGKMKQIFSNLIDNSIKYTPTGSITVAISSLEPEHKMLIKIQDTGIGIAPDEISNLFQKFNRASNANEANVLGTGLGLYIAREIMKAHGGWINVQSEGLGKGSTFTVELPICDEYLVSAKK